MREKEREREIKLSDNIYKFASSCSKVIRELDTEKLQFYFSEKQVKIFDSFTPFVFDNVEYLFSSRGFIFSV